MNLLLLEPQDIDTRHTPAQLMINDIPRIHHVKHVLQCELGDTLKVGIRGGLKGTATLLALSDTQMILTNIVCQNSPPAKLPLTLILCLPRPKVLRRMISDAVALGVEQIILLHSYRVDKSYWQTPYLARLDDYIRLGLEQAGDTIAPQITLEKRFKPFVEDRLPNIINGKTALLAHPYAIDAAPIAHNQASVLIVGTEGGFIPYEIDLLTQQGCHAVNIGTRILRTETALVALIGRLFG